MARKRFERWRAAVMESVLRGSGEGKGGAGMPPGRQDLDLIRVPARFLLSHVTGHVHDPSSPRRCLRLRGGVVRQQDGELFQDLCAAAARHGSPSKKREWPGARLACLLYWCRLLRAGLRLRGRPAGWVLPLSAFLVGSVNVRAGNVLNPSTCWHPKTVGVPGTARCVGVKQVCWSYAVDLRQIYRSEK